ncbi:hypothetical protein [Sutcliffiella sp. NC1]|uniref:hypothetical protein n=1 Tax=Sutcliffiella sp. NC1 TaxID=3004096 RepID=UPI0022DD7466|nr:hypothetical protein [Sutcliffiella sp. NC1]WBL16868.1 hypothetical protein O1A01_09625 [Sutcliffiella sp. NC1]
MFFSNSTIIVRINNTDMEKVLKNFSFFEESGIKNHSRKFYSINFYDNERKDIGEIHYTNSFEYGKMNVINFIRKSNLFFLFTSSIQHSKFFKKIITQMTNDKVSFDIVKIPLSSDCGVYPEVENFNVMATDNVFGIIGTLSFKGVPYLIKIYSNGLITFPFTNNLELIEEVISTSLQILKYYDRI